MPRQRIGPDTIGQAVEEIIPPLEDTAHKAIYWHGWSGLAASAVLRAIAEDPPSSLRRKFNKIIHIDCSRWKSRRALQREIAQQVKLPQSVMAIFDRQDKDDDFRGADEVSREEIQHVGAEIHQALQEHTCLVVFHNGSDDTIDLNDFGILQPMDRWSASGSKLLWTFRGRLRLNSEISDKVDSSHLYLYDNWSRLGWNYLLQEEAREIARYTDKLGEEVAGECCLYLLALNSQGGDIMDYNWAIHASNYWVCDGIVQGGHDNEAWEVAAALQQQIRIEDYSSNTLPSFGSRLVTPANRWIFFRDNKMTVHPQTTSFFFASGSDPPLPNGMFHQSDKLGVLKLCRCTFSFSSPPFSCCRSLRFLGLDSCKDQRQDEEDEKQDGPSMEFFQSLWVLDICYTDWELALSPEIIAQMAANIREVRIKKGRIWRSSLAWRQLQNLHKLRVIEPTRPWETGEMDEFEDLLKLELLDLSGNITIQVMPSLSGATSLKTLILDGCVGLEHVEGLPPSLESFSLDASTSGDQSKEAKVTRISMAGCSRLSDFKVRGSLPKLEELDLSGTSVKTLDLRDEVVQVPSLQQIILLGCLQLHCILWPEKGLPKLAVLRFDPLICRVQTELHQTYATIMDMRFFQTLVLKGTSDLCWKSNRFHLNLCVPEVKGESYMKEEMGTAGISGEIIPNPCHAAYTDVAIDKITIDYDYNSAPQFRPSGCHVEIGEGITNTNVETLQGINAIVIVMNKAESLHVHDNSSITTVIPERMLSTRQETLRRGHLKQCRVERCPKLHTVFTILWFEELESFCAAHLLSAHCIWSKGKMIRYAGHSYPFGKLRSIHLYSCPRLTFVLPLAWFGPADSYFPSLETLHIVNCGELKQVFHVEERIATDYPNGLQEFPRLKHIYLHELHKLQQICEAKMFAPNLETVKVRGCWGLRRLPAVGRRPVVDCEKDWWEKLEWDGLEKAGHHPSLFEPRHSSCYKKPLPRVSVLR